MYLKNCVGIVADLINEIGIILDDKKVEFREILGLSGKLFSIPQLVRQMPNAIEEIKAGVSDTYLAEIKKEVALRLKLSNQNTEKIVEACINWLLITSVTVNEIAKNTKLLK